MTETAIDIRERENEDKPHRRRSVLISPMLKFAPPNSRMGLGLNHAMLREIAKKSPTVSAIVELRCNQISEFARKPRYKGDRGFEITLTEPMAQMSKRQKKVAQEIEDFILKCGWTEDAMLRRDDFPGWISKVLKDVLVLNAPATELVYSQDGRLSEYWAVDGASIEIQWAERYIPTTRYGRSIDQPVAFVQIVDGQIMTEYAADELIYYPLNPSSNLELGGYGVSATELAVDWIAAEILAMQYNSNYFDQGSVPPGVLGIIGNYSQETVDELNTMWETDVKGVVGQHKPVALAMEDGKQIVWLPMKQSNKDMEMGDFLDKLSTKICSIFNVDPIELGQRAAMNSGGMSASENTEAKIDLSRSKGLIPILSWLERMINRFMMPNLAPGYRFRWTGAGSEDEKTLISTANSKGKEGGITYREWRKEVGLDEVPFGCKGDEKWLDCPMNPNAQQIWMQENDIGYSQVGKAETSGENAYNSAEENREKEIEKAWKSVNLYE